MRLRAALAAVLSLSVLSGCGGFHLPFGERGSPYWTMSGKLENDAQALATYAERFRAANDRWPESYIEWKEFTEKDVGYDVWLRRLDNLKFHTKDNDLIVIGEYEGPGYGDSGNRYGLEAGGEPVVLVIGPGATLKIILDPKDIDSF